MRFLQLTVPVYDIDDPNYLSLEQQKQKDNEEKCRKIASENKRKVLAMIEELRKKFDDMMMK